MLQYDNKGWTMLTMVFRMDASVLPQSSVLALFSALLSVFLVVLLEGVFGESTVEIWPRDLIKHPFGVQIYSIVLGYVIVFRTGMALGRYQEGATNSALMFGKWLDAFAQMNSFISVSRGPTVSPEVDEKLARLQRQLAHWYSMMSALAIFDLRALEDQPTIFRMIDFIDTIEKTEGTKRELTTNDCIEVLLSAGKPSPPRRSNASRDLDFLEQKSRKKTQGIRVSTVNERFVRLSRVLVQAVGSNSSYRDLVGTEKENKKRISIDDILSPGVMKLQEEHFADHNEEDTTEGRMRGRSVDYPGSRDEKGKAKEQRFTVRDISPSEGRRRSSTGRRNSEIIDSEHHRDLVKKLAKLQSESSAQSTGRRKWFLPRWRKKAVPVNNSIPVLGQFTKHEIQSVEESHQMVIMVLGWITQSVVIYRQSGWLKVQPPIMTRCFQELSTGMLAYYQASKVTLVPFPFPFTQMITGLLTIFLFVAPVMVTQFTMSAVMSPLLTFFVVLGFQGMNEIASELENPFGDDANDLPLVHMHRDFVAGLQSLSNMQLPHVYQSAFFGENEIKREKKQKIMVDLKKQEEMQRAWHDFYLTKKGEFSLFRKCEWNKF